MWDVYAVDMTGAILHHYTDAVLTEWTDELCSYKGGFKFKMPDISSNHNYDGVLTEFQIWRNGKFYDWGVSTKPHGTPSVNGELEVQCNSLMWYFYRRIFGQAFPAQILSGADLDTSADLALWSQNALTTAVIETDNVNTGAGAARLTNTVEQADAFLYQRPTFAPGPTLGQYAVLTAWFCLETMTAPALDQRGLYCDYVIGGVAQNPVWYPITMAQPTNVWTRVQSSAFAPVSATGYFDARLYCPKGQIVWDTVSLHLEDSVSTTYPQGSDQATFFASIIAYAQDAGLGKSDLNITVDAPTTGVIRRMSYFWVDNKKIWEAMLDLSKPDDGLEFGMVFPDADGTESPGTVSRRVLTTYARVPGSSPGKGVTWSSTDLLLKVNVTLNEVEPMNDADQITTAMIVQSGNTGTGREQGGYVDASHFGGLILETVEQAPESLSLNMLNAQARRRCLQLNQGAEIPVLRTRETASMPIIGRLKVGDIVPVDISYGGWATWAATYRVVRMVLDPAKDQLDLTLNVVSL